MLGGVGHSLRIETIGTHSAAPEALPERRPTSSRATQWATAFWRLTGLHMPSSLGRGLGGIYG